MTTRILPNRSWTDANGTFVSGTIATVTDAQANVYFQQGVAQRVDALPSAYPLGNIGTQVPILSGSSDLSTALTSPSGQAALAAGLAGIGGIATYNDETWCIHGDSITANNSITSNNIAIGGLVRSGGIVTATLANHGLQTNQNIYMQAGANSSTFAGRASITRIDANTFTYQQTAPDETSTVAHNYGKLDLFSSKSWWQYANALSGGKMRLLNNSGWPTQKTDQILVRLDADVLPYKPTWCTILAGINDVNSDVSSATICANLQSMYAKLLANQVKVVAMTLTPYNSTYGGYYSVARNQILLAVNAWIRRYVAATKGMYLADLYAAFINPADANGYGTAAYYAASDGVHMGANGAICAGTALWTAVSAEITCPSPLVVGAADTAHAVTASAAGNENLFSGGWTASGTTATGTGMSGTRDPAWLMSTAGGGSQTMVASIVARSDGFGYDQQGVMTSAAANDNFTIRTNYNQTASGTLLVCNELVSGGIYDFVFSTSLTGVTGNNLDQIQMYLQMTADGVSNIIPMSMYFGTSGDAPTADMASMVMCGRVKMPPFTTVTAFSVNFYFKFSAAGGPVTFKVGRGSIRKVG